MRGKTLIVVVALSALTGTASAQTSSCYWVGNVWTCNQQQSGSSIQWRDFVMPNTSSTIMDSFERGRKEGEEARRAKLESERLAAERDFYRSQIQNPTAMGQRVVTSTQAPQTDSSDFKRAWIIAAQPRMHIFPDFEKVVFAPNVSITDDMVRLMSSSTYAADIAYYLATHKAEAKAISLMPLLDAARAIDRIESQVKVSAQPGK